VAGNVPSKVHLYLAWQAERQRIQEEANRKRSKAKKEAIKGQPRNKDGTMVEKPGLPTTCGQTRQEGERSASAKAAATASNTNRGAVERMDRLDKAAKEARHRVIFEPPAPCRPSPTRP